MNRRDSGAATLFALALVNVLLVVATLGLVVASLAVTRLRAGTVADVAALAAAQTASDPCADAGAVAQGNGMRLDACTADGDDVLVVVSAPAPAAVVRVLALLGGRAADVSASARAGVPGS